MVTILDVAKKAGVSKSTASRVVANNGSVSAKARKQVEQAIAELGYRPNNIARSLKSNKSNIIGVVVVDMGSPFYSQILEGVQDVFIDTGKQLMVSSGYGHYDFEKKAVDSLIERRCDGLLLFLESELDVTSLPGAQVSSNLPIVHMGSKPSNFNAITIDNEVGAYQATKYLIEQGHRRIVHLAGQTHFADGRLRVEGFWRAVDEARIPRADCKVIIGEFGEAFGYQACKQLLSEPHSYTAIFAADDGIAAGCYSALREAGIQIPQQMSIIGYDDDFHARYMYPPLTTIRQPVVEMGKLAAELLLERLENPLLDTQRTVLQPQLMIRGSVAKID